MGIDCFVRGQLGARSAKVCGLVSKLVNLLGSLTKQSQFQVLRQSLGARMVLLQRTVRWNVLRDSTDAAEGAVVDAVAGLFNMPRCEDGRTRPRQELHQLTLPMRHGGFGLRNTEPLEAMAARLSGICVAQQVLADAPAVFRPLDGSHAAAPPIRSSGARCGSMSRRSWRTAAETPLLNSAARLHAMSCRSFSSASQGRWLTTPARSCWSARTCGQRSAGAPWRGCGPVAAPPRAPG